MKRLTTIMLKGITATFLIITLTHAESTIDYPSDYRYWTHIKSIVIQKDHPVHESFGGIHHIYANKQALIGYRTGNFPEGSIISFDLLDTSESNHALIEKKQNCSWRYD
jgi:hypothetical protein